MTMKYLKKNISAEFDEVVVTNVSLNNGVLTFARKDFYSDSTDGLSISIDLKDIKLRIYKLKTGEILDDYADTNDEDKILKRETHLFLVPTSHSNNQQYANNEGIYEEYIWDESTEAFELLGATHLTLEPLEGRITNVETAINTLKGRVNSLELNVTSLQENKVDKESGKSLIETSKITKLDNIQEEANKTIVDTEIKTSNNPVSNTAIKNALEGLADVIDANSPNVYEITDDMVNGDKITIDTNYDVFFIYSKKNYFTSPVFTINDKICSDVLNAEAFNEMSSNSLYLIISVNDRFSVYPITRGLVSDAFKNILIVDVVEDGNSGVVTSNAVNDAIQALSNNMELTTLDITYTNGNTDRISFYTKPKTSNGG